MTRINEARDDDDQIDAVNGVFFLPDQRRCRRRCWWMMERRVKMAYDDEITDEEVEDGNASAVRLFQDDERMGRDV